MGKFLELSLTTGYVPNWGKWEVLREFIQNALDSDDAGYPAEIRRNPNGTVVISNKGALLTRNTLLLGATSKADGGSRGKFGEGYKLAMLVACRMAKMEGKTDPPIRIKTGNEIWRPHLRMSENFGGETLQIEINPAAGDNSLTVYVSDVEDETWKQVENRVLNLKSSMSIPCPQGEILVSPDRRGQIFARGLWVCSYENASFGYNLKDIQLDRDRLVPVHYSLMNKLVYNLQVAVATGGISVEKLFEAISREGSLERSAYSEAPPCFSRESVIATKIWEWWKGKHGENAVPFTTSLQAGLIVASGRNPVQLPEQVFKMVLASFPESHVFDFEKVRLLEQQRVEKTFSLDDLGEKNSHRVRELLRFCERTLPWYGQGKVEIVKFKQQEGTRIDGLCNLHADCSYTIQISWDAIHDRELGFVFQRFIDIYLHELGHRFGSGDLTASHVNQITEDASRLVEFSLERLRGSF